MQPTQSTPEEKDLDINGEIPPVKKKNKFVSGLKKVGFHVWLGVMIIGGALAFIVALFLV
ncbi:hypothetical protein [Salinimicrobium terrae]|uniref:hypothetical protein n=1 Tax=Salinimicrobium terrae TaxID=470866 RepID=UPI00041B9CF6|nr:hypothetical protein [Salinimicrobium terrae]